MNVEHSGWSEKHGFFRYNVFVDENKEDYEIHYASGHVRKQSTPFHERTADWNNDGDVYSLFGAFFSDVKPDGSFGAGQFLTPEDMVYAVVEAMDEHASHFGDWIAAIPGIDVPSPEKRPSLEDQILQSERRRDAQSIERNRKMNALGIRDPGEPWAR